MRFSVPLGFAFAILATASLACESNEQILFSCGTGANDEGFISFCSDGDALSGPLARVHLSAANGGGPILDYQPSPGTWRQSFAFAHSNGPEGYLVTLRFERGGESYYLYSLAIPPSGEEDDMGGSDAGLARLLPNGRVADFASCSERPYMFIPTMRESFSCDTQSVFGAAACTEHGAERVAPLPTLPSPPIPVAP